MAQPNANQRAHLDGLLKGHFDTQDQHFADRKQTGKVPIKIQTQWAEYEMVVDLDDNRKVSNATRKQLTRPQRTEKR